jgi:hypothetical protein
MDTFLYDEAEHFIAGVTVLHLRARFEIERLGLEQIDELYDGHLRAHHLGEVVIPDWWERRCLTLMSFHAGGLSGKYFEAKSSTLSLPCSASCRMAAAVNCLVMEPSRNLVRGVLGTSSSRLAIP